VQKTEDNLRLRLVDYDTMYVPALKGRPSAEVGHRNYQHPDRTDADFFDTLDRFAGLVVYTALRACALQPDLWDRYNTGENLLFRDSDFYAPAQSSLFEDLADLNPISHLVDALRTACYVEPTSVPSLPQVKAGQVDVSASPIRRLRRNRTPGDRERTPFARAFLPASLAVLGLGVGVATAGLFGVAAVVLSVGVGTGGLLVGRRYQDLSVIRRRRRLTQERARLTETIRRLKRERERLAERRAELLNSRDERRATWLEKAQDKALRECLKRHFIGEVRGVDGLIHKHVVRLKAADIRTAYEATPEALDNVRRISDEARSRIERWRRELVQEYQNEIPRRLSPAQERRLHRYVEHRVEDLDEQRARIREKIEVQTTERERIDDRLGELPSFSVLDYVSVLFRMSSRPVPLRKNPRRARTTEARDRGAPPSLGHEPPSNDDDAAGWVQDAARWIRRKPSAGD